MTSRAETQREMHSLLSRAKTGTDLLSGLGIVGALVALVIALSLASPHFLTQDNLINVLKQAAPLGIMAVGQTILMISGGFDISVGATNAMAGAVAAVVWVDGMHELAYPAALAAGAAVGLVNGLIVTVLRVNPFIATLGTMLIIRSLTIPLTDSSIIIVPEVNFRWLGSYELLGVPLQLSLFVLALVLGGILLTRTSFGRYVYAIGGNREAARLSGLPVRSVRVSAFVICGLSAGAAGAISVSQLGIAGSQPGVGTGLEFAVIAAVVVGGTSLFGGRGAMWRTAVGVCFLAFLQNGFNLLNLDFSTQQAITGLVILIAVALDAFSRRGRLA